MRHPSITQLFDANFNFARLRKDGTYEGHKRQRKDTTHILEETKISIVATPLKSWPKHKSKNAGYGKPRYEMQVPTTKDQLEIPTGATHLEYSTTRVAIVDTIQHVHDFTHMRGQLRFGKYLRGADRFEYMDEGTELKDGTCVMNKDRELERVVREHPELPKPPKKKAGAPAVDLPKPPGKKAPSQPVATVKTPSAKVNRSKPPVKTGARAPYIDELLMEGGRTLEEVVALVIKKFPDRKEKETINNIKTRLWWLPNKLGKTPKPFKK